MNPPPESVTSLKERLDRHQREFDEHRHDYGEFKGETQTNMALLMDHAAGIKSLLGKISWLVLAALIGAVLNLILKGGS